MSGVCLGYEGMPGYVWGMRVCLWYESMSGVRGHVRGTKVCLGYEGMSGVRRYVWGTNVCPGYEGMSGVRRYVWGTKVCLYVLYAGIIIQKKKKSIEPFYYQGHFNIKDILILESF